MKVATQDGEPIKNVYRATHAKTSFSFERVPTFTLADISPSRPNTVRCPPAPAPRKP